MFPPASGYRYIELLPPALPEPVEVEFTFIGGKLDGAKHKATVKRELDSGVMVTIQGQVYRYSGNDSFTFEKEVDDAEQEKS